MIIYIPYWTPLATTATATGYYYHFCFCLISLLFWSQFTLCEVLKTESLWITAAHILLHDTMLVRISCSTSIHLLRFPKELPLPLGRSGPPSNTWYLRPTKSSSQMVYRSVQSFLYRSQMLCCTMHCQWGRKPPKLPLTLKLSLLCLRRTKPQQQAICTKNW